MNSYILVPVVLYTAWAIYSGYKYVNGRYPWLEQPEIAHRICKYAAITTIILTVLLAVTLTSCGEKDFICGWCTRSVHEKPHEARILGQDVELCDDCYKELKNYQTQLN